MPVVTLLGNALLLIAGGALIVDLRQRRCTGLAALCLWLALALLAAALVGNRFELLYVYSYSAEALPLWLKLACLWSGEQGTLLLLTAMLAMLAWAYRSSRASAIGMQCLALAMLAGCLWFNAFAPALQFHADGLGLNAHLLSPWMALHPPAVLLSYALLWVPVGAAVHGLAGGPAAAWLAAVQGAARTGWAMLSLGLASGMWWAFEDFTFGQFWHWDPVQTAVFVVWALATAQMHGMRQIVLDRPVPPLLLWSSILCAASIPFALLVVRDATLASSHRYIGDTSRWLMLALAIGQVVIALFAVARRAPGRSAPIHPQLLRMATLVLLLGAAAACLSLVYSYVCAGLECSRDFVPFRQAVLHWAGGEELQRLTDAFAQWEVDHFVITRLLLPAVAAMLLLTGYAFGKPLSRHAGWYTLLFAVAAAALAVRTQPLEQLIDGTGVTTRHTTALFIILDVLLLWCIWPVLMTLGWCIRAWRTQHLSALRRTIPVGLLHLGAVLVIVGATVASTLDSSVQRSLELPRQYGELMQLGANLELSVDAPQRLPANDGAVGGASLLAVTEIHYSLHANGVAKRHAGILYRDQRSTLNNNELSSFRQRCMVLDYRFSRVLDRPGHVLHPVIDRGWLSDWQIWMPAEPPSVTGEQREVVLLARRFPLMSVLWTGLVLILFSAFMLLFSGNRFHH